MDLEGHYPQNTVLHCIISIETQITLHFFRVGCKAGSPSWAPPSSEQFPPPWERCLNGLLFVTFCAVPLKFNKYYVIKKLADIFVLSLLASLIHVLEHYATYSFYYAIYKLVLTTFPPRR